MKCKRCDKDITEGEHCADCQHILADPVTRMTDVLSTMGDNIGATVGAKVATAVADAVASSAEETRNLIETLRVPEPSPDDEEPGDAVGDDPPQRGASPSDRMVDAYTAGWSDRNLSPADNAAAVR